MWAEPGSRGRIVAQEVLRRCSAAAFRFSSPASCWRVSHYYRGRHSAPGRRAREGIVTGLAFTGIFLYALCFSTAFATSAGRGIVRRAQPGGRRFAAWFVGQERMSTDEARRHRHRAGRLPDGDRQRRSLALLAGAVGMGEWLIVRLRAVLDRLHLHRPPGDARRFRRWQRRWRRSDQRLLLGIAAARCRVVLPSSTDWSWRVLANDLFLAVCGTALRLYLVRRRRALMGAARASPSSIVPVFANRAAERLGERLAPAVLAGGALVIAGVWLTPRTDSGENRMITHAEQEMIPRRDARFQRQERLPLPANGTATTPSRPRRWGNSAPSAPWASPCPRNGTVPAWTT